MVKYIFLGATNFSKVMLETLIKNNFLPSAIFAIPQYFHIKYRNEPQARLMQNYNFADLETIAEAINCPFYLIDGSNGYKINNYAETIQKISPDLILVLGWYYLVPKNIREIAPLGAWGIHASLLPKYAGGSPLVWAIINGEKKTGVSLFKLDDGVDDGDIIAQKSFLIDEVDTIKEVYDKAIQASKDILIDVLKNIDNLKLIKQDKSKIEIWPQRKPEDGLLDWNQPAKKIYDFIRAQTLPYPCAFTFINDEKIKIISAKKSNLRNSNEISGTIVMIDNRVFVSTLDYFIIVETIEFNGHQYGFDEFVRARNLVGKIFSSTCQG